MGSTMLRPVVPVPASIGLEPALGCSLECPHCPSRMVANAPSDTMLAVADLRSLLDRHPQIRQLYLRGRGEVFMNLDLPELLRLAHERGISTTMEGASNLNVVSAEAAEAVVRYGVRSLRCAVDGVSQGTYGKLRRGGNLAKALQSIRAIIALKAKYRSAYPDLILQFMPTADNIHELDQVAMLARMLGMSLRLRYKYGSNDLDLAGKAKLRRYSGAADREEFQEQTGRHFYRNMCAHLWIRPAIAWDGRIIGCNCNHDFSYFPGNAFQDDLSECLNSEPMVYAREMLMGQQPARADIPCVHCACYQDMKSKEDWVTETEIAQRRTDQDDASVVA